MTQFTIITVVRNDLAGLKKTAESVCSQSFTDYEWIVIDGASTDGTIEYLQSLDTPSCRWISEPDRGIYDAMNKGIQMGSGEYVVFLNAGDALPETETLALVSQNLASSDYPDVLFGSAQLVFANGKSIRRPPKNMNTYIWHGLPANHQATYYKRDTLGDLLYDLDYKISGDYFIIAKLYLKGIHAAYLNQSIVQFSVGGASYQNRKLLFLEPYRIQRDVLRQSFPLRLASLCKRLIATAGMVFLQKF